MAAYSGRRGPNVSQYLRDLNTAQTQDPAVVDDNVNFDDDLAMFTNTQFFDYESGRNTDFHPQASTVDAPPTTPSASSPDAMTSANSVMGDLNGLDFMSPDFNFTDFGAHTYASPTLASFPDPLSALQPLQPGPSTVYAASQPQPAFVQPTPRTGEKRKSDAGHSSSRPVNFEEASRFVAEEDKRRRNTAASARFRVKKKQREQALEKSAKTMTEKVTVLEGRVNQLETENKWLKNLIMEKNGSKEDLANMLRDMGNKRPDELTAIEGLKAES